MEDDPDEWPFTYLTVGSGGDNQRPMRRKQLFFMLALVVFTMAFIPPECTNNSTGCVHAPGNPLNPGSDEVCSGGGGEAPPVSPFATVLMAHTGAYSHDHGALLCQGDASTAIDPITFVTRMEVSKTGHTPVSYLDAIQHLTHHGWDGTTSVDQDFHAYATDDCVEGNASMTSTNSIFNFGDRWHARGLLQGFVDPWISDAVLGAWTPHYDEQVICSLKPKHAVPQDWYGDGTNWSGFSEARDRLTYLWLTNANPHGWNPEVFLPHHTLIGDPATHGSEFWGNRTRMKQCNDWRPASDGYVYLLGLD